VHKFFDDFKMFVANCHVLPHVTNRHNVRIVSSVDQAVIDLVEGVSWGVSNFEVDSFVHEVRTFDRHLPVCYKVDQSEAIFICTLMQAVLAFRGLMFRV
jgi:hypothetical protein